MAEVAQRTAKRIKAVLSSIGAVRSLNLGVLSSRSSHRAEVIPDAAIPVGAFRPAPAAGDQLPLPDEVLARISHQLRSEGAEALACAGIEGQHGILRLDDDRLDPK